MGTTGRRDHTSSSPGVMEKGSTPSPASLRWAILRRAFVSRSSLEPDSQSQLNTKSISRKTAGGFNLISCNSLNGRATEDLTMSLKIEGLGSARDAYVRYKLPIEGVPELTLIQRTEECIDLNDFEISTRYDIDTTGLICCWPSEDVLAYFCLNHVDIFRSKRILELGSGYGMAGLAIAASTDAHEVIISDGNPQVVEYIQRNINLNAGVFGDTKVKSLTLHWSQEQAFDILNPFDIIVASDCTFFKEYHEGLAHTVKSLLKHSEVSEAIFFSPKRGDSLEKFLRKITEVGLHFELIEKHDVKVWNLHEKFLGGHDASWPNYDKDHCYPMLVRITFQKLGDATLAMT